MNSIEENVYCWEGPSMWRSGCSFRTDSVVGRYVVGSIKCSYVVITFCLSSDRGIVHYVGTLSFAGVAQLVEHSICNRAVFSSSLNVS